MFQEKMEITKGKLSGLKCVTFHSNGPKDMGKVEGGHHVLYMAFNV